MLEFLRGKASERKLRLFACACCRRLSIHFKDKRSQRMVEVSELYAEGIVGADALESAFDAAAEAQEVIHWEGGDAVDQSTAEAVLGLRDGLDFTQVLDGAYEAAGAVAVSEAWAEILERGGRYSHEEVTRASQEAEERAQTGLLRCIFGNPFRPITLQVAWRTSAVMALARAVHDERRFQDMRILADALEEVGCTDAEILRHLRGPGPHVLGCWALDRVLGRV
jgi:hypothetical protein